MNDTQQKQLGSTLWAIADKLRGAMNADDFRDYMLSFLFLRYLSDNYEEAVKRNWEVIIRKVSLKFKKMQRILIPILTSLNPLLPNTVDRFLRKN